jgi:hypothetical protein
MAIEGKDLREIRELVDTHTHLVYEAIKAGTVSELPHEEQIQARAIQDHLHLRHVRAALEHAAEFAGGSRYEIQSEGGPVSPLAHIAMHAGVEAQLEGGNEDVKGRA